MLEARTIAHQQNLTALQPLFLLSKKMPSAQQSPWHASNYQDGTTCFPSTLTIQPVPRRAIVRNNLTLYAIAKLGGSRSYQAIDALHAIAKSAPSDSCFGQDALNQIKRIAEEKNGEVQQYALERLANLALEGDIHILLTLYDLNQEQAFTAIRDLIDRATTTNERLHIVEQIFAPAKQSSYYIYGGISGLMTGFAKQTTRQAKLAREAMKVLALPYLKDPKSVSLHDWHQILPGQILKKIAYDYPEVAPELRAFINKNARNKVNFERYDELCKRTELLRVGPVRTDPHIDGQGN
jgi:hypothetical protein